MTQIFNIQLSSLNPPLQYACDIANTTLLDLHNIIV